MSRAIRLSIFAVVSLLITALAAPISAVPDPAVADLVPHHPDRVLVKVTTGNAAAVLGPEAVHIFGRWYEVPTLPGEHPVASVQRLERLAEIEVVELDRVTRLEPGRTEPAEITRSAAVTPNDPGYWLQWHLPAIEMPDAWETTSGSGVVVAVVDSGISLGGDDLDCRPLAAEFNAITNVSGPGSAADDNSHGTHVAGTVGQCTGNGVGVAGVAGNASLMAIKVLDASGNGYTSDTAQGIEWAASHGADVINLSLSSSCPSAIHFDAVDAAISAGVVVVAATGNDADESEYDGQIGSPSCHPDVIAVGATDFNDDRADYSNWGVGIDVVAPGGDIGADENGDGRGDGVLQETFDSAEPTSWGLWWSQGTSMAAPHVSGTAALLLAANPAATAYQVKRALEVTAEDRGSPGWDMYYGHGLINADDAIDAILDTEAPSWSGEPDILVTPGDTYSFAGLFQEHGGYNIVAAADYFEDRMTSFGDKFGVKPEARFTGLNGYQRLLEQKLDAVVIESPPYFHPIQAAAAVDAGKHVYLAKPIAVDVPGCKTIEESGNKASSKGLCFLVDFQTRADPFYIEVLKRVHDGAIGRFAFGESTYHAGIPWMGQIEYARQADKNPEARLRAWGLDQILSGDIITEQNIHTLDVASWIMDQPPLCAFGTGLERCATLETAGTPSASRSSTPITSASPSAPGNSMVSARSQKESAIACSAARVFWRPNTAGMS